MSKHQEIVKRRSEYLGTAQPSLRDSVIARMLDLAAQVHRQEVMLGEARLWAETFKDESPETLEWAFREQLRTGKFFPKPADITELIERKRLSVGIDIYDRAEILRKQFEAHGCSSGWIFKPNGVVRCPDCAKLLGLTTMEQK